MIPIYKYNTCCYLFNHCKATQVEELQCHPTLPHMLASQVEELQCHPTLPHMSASQAEPNQDP